MADTKNPTKARARRASAPKSTAAKKVAKSERAPTTTVAYASKYAVGDQISHPMFGHGAVAAIDSNKLTIEFPDNVTKQIVDDYVKLQSP
jgi:hypothetical protein